MSRGRSAQLWPDERTVRAARLGNREAIALLLDVSHPHVQRFARVLCSTPEDAEEAAQEALIVLFRKIGTLRAAAALASWAFQIVRRECIRRSRLSIHGRVAKPGSEPSAEDVALARLEVERIVDAIAQLPSEQRLVVVLRDVQGLSGSATEQLLGLSRAAMKSRLHRAREALHAELIDAPRLTTPAGTRATPH
jgi:RNA polymerase sigma factor (sigma-70 family)